MKMPRSMRMGQRGDFARVRRDGKSAGGRYLVVATLPDETIARARFGFITSKRIGNAVARNRVRRRLRAIVQREGDGIDPGRLVVMIARKGAAEAAFADLHREWLRLARRTGVLREVPRTTGG